MGSLLNYFMWIVDSALELNGRVGAGFLKPHIPLEGEMLAQGWILNSQRDIVSDRAGHELAGLWRQSNRA